MKTVKPKTKKPAKKREEPKKAPLVESAPEPEIGPDLLMEGELEPVDQTPGAREKYYESVGRRKSSVARVRLMTRKSTDQVDEDSAILTVNGKKYSDYFTDKNLLALIEAPLRKLKSLHRFKASVLVSGGGSSGQAGAVRHGIARALEKFDINFRKKLKKAGYLTRDPREKERRKFGHKKARKSGRWSKR